MKLDADAKPGIKREKVMSIWIRVPYVTLCAMNRLA